MGCQSNELTNLTYDAEPNASPNQRLPLRQATHPSSGQASEFSRDSQTATPSEPPGGELAKGLDHEAVKGYSQLNKAHLLPAVCQALGIDAHEHHHVVGAFDKSAVKAKMRSLKAERQAAIESGDHAKLKALRRYLHRLNRQSLLPVDTDWDLGVGDSTAIQFTQSLRSGEVRVIDYYENTGEGIPQQSMPLDPGTTLGPYHVTAKIGEGGMGEVYRAASAPTVVTEQLGFLIS